jgi:hypothetical protein
MATIACQGCSVLFDGSGITQTGVFGTYAVRGQGNGVFSGIVNALIGFVTPTYSQGQNGICLQLTGKIFNTGTNPNSGWTANTLTGCTGIRECTSRLTFYINPAQYLFNQFPGSTFGFSVFNYTQGQWTGITVTSGSIPPSPLGYPVRLDTVTQECGTLSWYQLESRWTAPIGLSGFLTSVTGHRVECTYCSPYEMVSL